MIALARLVCGHGRTGFGSLTLHKRSLSWVYTRLRSSEGPMTGLSQTFNLEFRALVDLTSECRMETLEAPKKGAKFALQG